MSQILSVTFPFFALVLCGWLAARSRLLPLEAIPGLNVFVLFFALPCLLYRFASNTPIVQLLDPGLLLTYLLCALTMVGLALVLARRRSFGWGDASMGALVAAFPNSGFMGLPLLVALLGPQVAGPTIVALAVDMVFTSSLCIALSQLDAAGAQGVRPVMVQALKGMATNPLPWSIALGALTAASGLGLPRPALRVVEMLAEAASPTALFTIGVVLARPRRAAPSGSAPAGDIGVLVAFKLLVHPALVWVAGRLMMAFGVPLDPFALTVLMLTAALPSASNVSMLAERLGADSGRVAQVILVTTAASSLTFSAAVALLR